ncbi:uncharacterized protein NMK_0212 [Novimethylophilus kurashikiensis]|uniref:Uncharacterized protein n=1 Tax=Novimethylophilus kurashikiensis TaxID=1825523 RepID=A0A2R5F1Z8_9PROT|nr:hypothetical protein [Novimethylophilus kurashikiensis]GBG12680.1 uncharacterized protein NMK_0212 [Novimethylophilus kurashikiensis]
MKIKSPSEVYLEKARQLSEEETERLFSRMGSKLRKKQEKEKVNVVEALAIQLELEDEMLREWRERFAEIKQKHDKKEDIAKSEDRKPEEQSAGKTPEAAKPAKKPRAKKAV